MMMRITKQVIFRNIIANTNKALFSKTPFQNSSQSTPFHQEQHQSAEEIKTAQIVSKNLGLSKFITRTYNTTALSIVGALTSGYVGGMIPALMMNPGVTSIAFALSGIACLIGVNYMKPHHVVDKYKGFNMYRTENPISRILVYSMGIASIGLSASPLFLAVQSMAPSILPSAIGITAGIFGGASAFAYMLPKDKMLGFGKILTGSLLGLICMQLVGLGSMLFVGPNALSSLLFTFDNYAGIALFSGLIAYDTHIAIKSYESGVADHLGMSVQLVLDFWNILLRVISILSNRD